MSTTSVPAIQCDKMAVNGISFRQSAMNNSLRWASMSDFVVCMEMPAWARAVSEGFQTEIGASQPLWGQQRSATNRMQRAESRRARQIGPKGDT